MRRAVTGDAPELFRCIEAAYSNHATRIPDLPVVSEGIADEILNNIVWITETGGTIAGGIILIPRDGFLVVANIAVHPDHSGKGLGRALMDIAASESRQRGLSEMRLSTHADIPETVSLYEHLGWRETGRSGNKVHMSKTVTRGTG